ncbi:MAG: c-type cytochrome [Ilumatobacteraceae bacterium]
MKRESLTRPWVAFGAALIFVAGGTLLGASGTVSAAADIEVDAPAESTVGESVTVTATISDGGEPVADAVVTVARKAQIGGVSGFAALDSGVTDADGVVELEFIQLADSTDIESLRIEYEGPDGVEAAEFELTVLPGGQQNVSSSGADVGILNISWLIVVLVIVWAFLLIATWQLVKISRAREGGRKSDRLVPLYMVGFVAFTALGMFYVVLTQPTMHANLAPNEPFDRVPTAYLGQEYDYLGLGGDPADRPDDLSGEVLYVQAGCASCHGIGGNGAVVGGELTDSVLNDAEEMEEAIRRGPKGMPVYSETLLTQEEIDRIVEFLLSLD